MKSAAKTDVSIGYEVDGRRIDALVEDACAADEAFREHSRNVASITSDKLPSSSLMRSVFLTIVWRIRSSGLCSCQGGQRRCLPG